MPSELFAMRRPQRWDVPFGRYMTDTDVDRVLTIEPFNRIDAERFPTSVPLRGILRNDTRIKRFQAGDIIVRRGDYGHSAFLILSGSVRVELDLVENPLPIAWLGRQKTKRKSVWKAVAQWWSNHRHPEFRPATQQQAVGIRQQAIGNTRPATGVRHPDVSPSFLPVGSSQMPPEEDGVRIFLQDLPAVLDEYRTTSMAAGQLFGELAALGRTPRTATVFADSVAELLEIRWQGLRDLLRRDQELKKHIDRIFRERALGTFLNSTPMFSHLTPQQVEIVAATSQLETYGQYDSVGSFKDLADKNTQGGAAVEQEPSIVDEGDYPNGLIMIRSGLARLSCRVNHGHRTVNYLVPGQSYGLDELAQNWQGSQHVPFAYSLRAVGYVNVIVVPTPIIEEFVLKRVPSAESRVRSAESKTPLPLSTPDPALSTQHAPGIATEMLEFLVERRYVNGTASMIIDLNRCTRCDDCVRACAATHDNNPRFIRQGPIHDHYMVANACMHCLDPVCMIECPTGAIHRDPKQGVVVINDATCIGCTACAQNCPYDAIRMVEIRDQHGDLFLDQNKQPINKATKCNLCIDQLGGPACQRACPHDALKRVDMRDPPVLAHWLNR
jgi:Fe-S-cluster-containing dehydrogenase component/CRP-like cAMP-binding protein